MSQWQLQEAKQQFSRVVEQARTEGPQIVTKHGREVAVVLDVDDYRRLRGESGFRDFLIGPLYIDVDLPIERDRDPGPDIELVSYLLDTNVVSELRKGPASAPAVAAWARLVESADLSMSVLVLGEIRHGIELLRRRSDSKQADMFTKWLDRLRVDFADRLIPVSPTIAERWGELRGITPLPPIDGLMAATALEHNLTFVTRDTTPLRDTGVRLLNPWRD